MACWITTGAVLRLNRDGPMLRSSLGIRHSWVARDRGRSLAIDTLMIFSRCTKDVCHTKQTSYATGLKRPDSKLLNRERNESDYWLRKAFAGVLIVLSSTGSRNQAIYSGRSLIAIGFWKVPMSMSQ